MAGIGIIVRGVVIGLMLAAFGCRNETRSASGIQMAPQAAVVKAPDNKTGSQNVQPPGAAVQTQPPQSIQSKPEKSRPPVDLTLRFSPGAAAVYRVIMEQGRSVAWQGAASTRPAGFEDGRTDNRSELTFRQEVLSVDPVGDAVVKITIEALKYFNCVHNKVGLDFDSARPADQENPLARLIGQSYRIKLSRKGDVLGIVEATQARSAVPANSPAFAMVQRLLSEDGIKERHAIPALAALRDGQVRPGQSWTSEKSFSFSWMGSKSFDRVYTLREVSRDSGGQLAVVEMEAMPAAGQPQSGQALGAFAGIADNTTSYDGRFVFELDSGRVREYAEQMQTEWVVPDPEAIEGKTDPAAVQMAAHWLRRVELVR
jgi:hypothetical protein